MTPIGSPENPGGEYALGFRPRAWLFVDGVELAATRARGATTTPVGYHCAISRVECVLGIDQVNTMTLTLVGEEAAKLVKERFAKRMPVKVEVGYEDRPETRFALFDGHLLQANPSGTNPVTVEVEGDSLMYQAREDRGAADTTDATHGEFIKSRLFAQDTPINTNLEGLEDAEVDEGGTHDANQDRSSLLDFIQRWSRDNFVHWIDHMNGQVTFFYPGIKPMLYRPWRTWHVSPRKTKREDPDPAILTEWSPRQSFVEAPETITAVYYAEDESRITTGVVEARNDRGQPDTTLHIGNLYVKDKPAAQAIVDAAAEYYYWHVIEGGFAMDVGLHILPLDELVAHNPPPGLEDYYGVPFEVTQVKHVLDVRGWRVSGRMRAPRGA